jgi:hypothetical protein
MLSNMLFWYKDYCPYVLCTGASALVADGRCAPAPICSFAALPDNHVRIARLAPDALSRHRTKVSNGQISGYKHLGFCVGYTAVIANAKSPENSGHAALSTSVAYGLPNNIDSPWALL